MGKPNKSTIAAVAAVSALAIPTFVVTATTPEGIRAQLSEYEQKLKEYEQSQVAAKEQEVVASITTFKAGLTAALGREPSLAHMVQCLKSGKLIVERAAPVALTEAQRTELKAILTAEKTRATAGVPTQFTNEEIAGKIGCAVATVMSWKKKWSLQTRVVAAAA